MLSMSIQINLYAIVSYLESVKMAVRSANEGIISSLFRIEEAYYVCIDFSFTEKDIEPKWVRTMFNRRTICFSCKSFCLVIITRANRSPLSDISANSKSSNMISDPLSKSNVIILSATS